MGRWQAAVALLPICRHSQRLPHQPADAPPPPACVRQGCQRAAMPGWRAPSPRAACTAWPSASACQRVAALGALQSAAPAPPSPAIAALRPLLPTRPASLARRRRRRLQTQYCCRRRRRRHRRHQPSHFHDRYRRCYRRHRYPPCGPCPPSSLPWRGSFHVPAVLPCSAAAAAPALALPRRCRRRHCSLCGPCGEVARARGAGECAWSTTTQDAAGNSGGGAVVSLCV